MLHVAHYQARAEANCLFYCIAAHRIHAQTSVTVSAEGGVPGGEEQFSKSTGAPICCRLYRLGRVAPRTGGLGQVNCTFTAQLR